MTKQKITTDAVKILHGRYYRDSRQQLDLQQARDENEVARKLYQLRTEAGLSQRGLTKLIGTTASVICRLEDADYEGHSLAMLTRIASALKQRIEINFVPQIRKRALAREL